MIYVYYLNGYEFCDIIYFIINNDLERYYWYYFVLLLLLLNVYFLIRIKNMKQNEIYNQVKR